MGSTFRTAAALAFVGLFLGAGMGGATAVRGSRPKMGRVAAFLGLGAFALTLLSAVYVMMTLPTAVNQDSGATDTSFFTIDGFWGSRASTFAGASATISWAAGWGWSVVLGAAVMFLIGGLASLRAPRGSPGGTPMAPQFPNP